MQKCQHLLLEENQSEKKSDNLLRKLGQKSLERKQSLKQDIWASLLIIRVDIRKILNKTCN